MDLDRDQLQDDILKLPELTEILCKKVLRDIKPLKGVMKMGDIRAEKFLTFVKGQEVTCNKNLCYYRGYTKFFGDEINDSNPAICAGLPS